MKGWDKITLGEICLKYGGKVQTGPFGSQLHEYDYKDVGIPVIMPKDISGNTVNIDNIAKISIEKANSLSKHKVKEGDIVFPKMCIRDRNRVVSCMDYRACGDLRKMMRTSFAHRTRCRKNF